ncbi:uncharacterized protein LOC113794095 [Dermatophagoides pteronyssinus]|uniref:uncharacterized protein LOC113794095 n=1 Tax=Dermatophagoides pteronyssinus TaxID=6956 RepID=UPI003F66387F
MSSRRNKRYFSDLNEEKYAPGKLSSNLRQALGLENDMLPFWIYRMRILGYPPVWLQTAQSKTLAVIDNTTTKSDKPSSSLANGEDGELDDHLKYNKDILIEYPGFNAPVPKNVHDDWVILGMPPFQPKQHLNVAAEQMQFIEPVPYKRTKLNNDNDSNSTATTTTDDDSNTNPGDDQHSKDATNNHQDNKNNMEKIQPENEEILIKSENDNEEKDEQINCINQSEDHHPDLMGKDTNSSSSSSSNNTSTTPITAANEKKMKIVSYGTPVPQTVRPKLPALEKWSIGMGELLHFENLPNSTGAYQGKIKNIIDKVRKRFKK